MAKGERVTIRTEEIDAGLGSAVVGVVRLAGKRRPIHETDPYHTHLRDVAREDAERWAKAAGYELTPDRGND